VGLCALSCGLAASVPILLELLQELIADREPAFLDLFQKVAGGIIGVTVAQAILMFVFASADVAIGEKAIVVGGNAGADVGGPTLFARIGVVGAFGLALLPDINPGKTTTSGSAQAEEGSMPRPPTDAPLLLRPTSVENECGLKHPLNVRPHFHGNVLPYGGKILRQIRKRPSGFDLGLLLSVEFQTFLVRVQTGVIPDVEVVPGHAPPSFEGEQ
jgi:hypothetical protein